VNNVLDIHDCVYVFYINACACVSCSCHLCFSYSQELLELAENIGPARPQGVDEDTLNKLTVSSFARTSENAEQKYIHNIVYHCTVLLYNYCIIQLHSLYMCTCTCLFVYIV